MNQKHAISQPRQCRSLQGVHRVSSRLSGPVDPSFQALSGRLTLGHVDPSFRALSGRLKCTVRRLKCSEDSFEGAPRKYYQGEARSEISSRRVFTINSRTQWKLLHTCIILLILKEHLGKNVRMGGQTECVSQILAKSKSPLVIWRGDTLSTLNSYLWTLISKFWTLKL